MACESIRYANPSEDKEEYMRNDSFGFYIIECARNKKPNFFDTTLHIRTIIKEFVDYAFPNSKSKSMIARESWIRDMILLSIYIYPSKTVIDSYIIRHPLTHTVDQWFIYKGLEESRDTFNSSDHSDHSYSIKEGKEEEEKKSIFNEYIPVSFIVSEYIKDNFRTNDVKEYDITRKVLGSAFVNSSDDISCVVQCPSVIDIKKCLG